MKFKQSKLALVLGIAVVAFSACDKLDDLNTKTIKDIEVSEKVLIEVDKPAPQDGEARLKSNAITFSKKMVLNLNTVTELKDYLSHIDDMNMKKVSCKITNIKAGILQNMKLNVPDLNYTVALSSITPGQSITVDFTAQQLDAIDDKLAEDKELTININGSVSEAPVSFNVEITVLTDVEVEIL